MFRQIFIQTVCLLLLFVLLYTGISKWLNFMHFSRSMYSQPLPDWLVDWLIYLIPVAEIIAAMLLILTRFRLLGLWVAAALMVFFTAYVFYIRFSDWEKITCPCGGLFAQLNWTQHAWVNSILTILAITTTIMYRNTNTSFPGHGKRRNADASN